MDTVANLRGDQPPAHHTQPAQFSADHDGCTAGAGALAFRKFDMQKRVARDLTVKLQEDRPGELAAATEAIASTDVNIDGCAEIEGIFHVFTENLAETRHALEGSGFQLQGEQDVLVIAVQDEPGVAAKSSVTSRMQA